MDVLSDILRPLRLRGGVYFRCEFSAPWGMAINSTPVAEFHVVVQGNCWVRMAAHEAPIPLGSGDLVVFPHGDAHTLLDAPGSSARPAAEILEGQKLDDYGPVTYGGAGQSAEVLCGYFEFERNRPHPIVAALPALVHIRSTDTADLAWLRSVITFMIHETKAARPGSELLLNRLSEVLFVQMIRAHLQQSATPPAIWSAIADKQIGYALQLMHGTPQNPWTLDALAKQVGMSRSAFVSKFGRMVGQTPLEYLTALRMRKAEALLAEGRMSTAAIAEAVGYRSEPAFSKTFKKLVGIGPGAYKRGVHG